jgi:hypothetical protein
LSNQSNLNNQFSSQTGNQSTFYNQNQQNTQGSTLNNLNANRPTSVLYQGPQAAKINNFI